MRTFSTARAPVASRSPQQRTRDEHPQCRPVRPERYDAARTQAIASEIASVNRRLVEEKRASLLIGFGRWGSQDPWLGIPVGWGQIAAARAVVEAALPSLPIEPSQGSHFFHNHELPIPYFTVLTTRCAAPTEMV
jgi:hypothetical protein